MSLLPRWLSVTLLVFLVHTHGFDGGVMLRYPLSLSSSPFPHVHVRFLSRRWCEETKEIGRDPLSLCLLSVLDIGHETRQTGVNICPTGRCCSGGSAGSREQKLRPERKKKL